MLIFGDGQNDYLGLADPTAIASGTVPRKTGWLDVRDVRGMVAILATTDGAGIWGGSTVLSPPVPGIIGSWKVEGSNNIPSEYDRRAGQPEIALNPNGTPVDITGNFVRRPVGAAYNMPLLTVTAPTLGIPDPPGGNAGTYYPLEIANLGYRHIQFTFTPSSNQGPLQHAGVFIVAKGEF